MRILFATPEIAPWVKTGGLGDVAGALPRALRALGADVQVIVPGYPRLLEAFPSRHYLARFHHPGGRLYDAELYSAQTDDGLPLLLIDCPAYYARTGSPYQDEHGHDWADNALRFGLLSRTAAWLASGTSPLSWRPDILHCHDWQTALAPAYLRYTLPPGAATVLTIHNLAFHGVFPAATADDLGLPPHSMVMNGVEFHGSLSFLKAGLQLSDLLTTVSPTYAREIQDPHYGFGLDGLLRWRSRDLIGILNGIDTSTRNPTLDGVLARPYDAEHLDAKAENKAVLQSLLGIDEDLHAPLLAVVSRLTHQKGIDLVLQAADELIDEGAQFAVLGTGERWLQQAMLDLAQRHPRRIGVHIGYDDSLGRRIEGGSDIFLMPSRFEPCGLGQMYALLYGVPPVVRATGGLADTVVDCNAATLADGTANGFVFEHPTAEGLLGATHRAIAAWHDRPLWQRLQRAGMSRDFGWGASAARYLEVFATLVREKSR